MIPALPERWFFCFVSFEMGNYGVPINATRSLFISELYRQMISLLVCYPFFFDCETALRFWEIWIRGYWAQSIG